MSDIYKGKKVLVTGSNGFLGKHVVRQLARIGATVVSYEGDLLPDPLLLSHMPSESLRNIDLIIHLAAIVKGAAPNRQQPYRFLRNNSLMALHAVDLALWLGVPIVAAGSVCAYPEDAPIPFEEKDFWKGKVDRANYGYGIAKRLLGGALECAAIQEGLRYVHLISSNLYGTGDHFDQDGHVIPSLILRIEEARIRNLPTVEVWGTGKPTRDMLYVEDAADAYVLAGAHLLRGGDNLECNIGSGQEVEIAYIAAEIKRILGYGGELVFNTEKPDGQMRRRVDSSLAQKVLGWMPLVSLYSGLVKTVAWFRAQVTA